MKMKRTRAVLSGLLLLGGLASAPGSAWAEDAGVGVEIGPAKIEQDLSGRAISRDFLIVNHESQARAVTMSVAGLGHDLDGAPQFLEPAAATNALKLSATTFTLEPHAKKTVHMSGQLPSGAQSLYGAVIAEFAPVTRPQGAVESRSRVASLLLYRGPKPWVETTSVIDVGLAQQKGTRALKVFASIKDTGNVHVRPTGSVKIIQNGRTLATVPLASQLIIPGFARRLTGSWTPPVGFTGPVTLEATTGGGGRGTKTTSLSDGSVGAIASASIRNLRGKGGVVSLDVLNTGPIAVTPSVTLIATEDGIERARVILPQPRLSVGKATSVEWKPDLGNGLYVIIAELNDGGTLLDQTITALPIGLVGAEAGKPHAGSGLAWGLTGLLLAVVLITFAIWNRKRRIARPIELTRIETPEPASEWTRAAGL